MFIMTPFPMMLTSLKPRHRCSGKVSRWIGPWQGQTKDFKIVSTGFPFLVLRAMALAIRLTPWCSVVLVTYYENDEI